MERLYDPCSTSNPLRSRSWWLTSLPGNPFSRRESHTSQSITTYKILTLLSWLLAVITSVFYSVDEPKDGFHIRQRIWDLNNLYRTAFTLNPIIASIYWYVCLLHTQVASPPRL